MREDTVDLIIRQWNRTRPSLDVSGLGIVNRIVLLARHLHRLEKRALKRSGLNPWAFEVLAALRRQGSPYKLSPTELRHFVVLTSGAMTNRLDRLEEQGLVTRGAHPEDRRAVVITLLPKGRELVDRAIDARLEQVAKVLAPLSRRDRAVTIDVLRKLMLGIDA